MMPFYDFKDMVQVNYDNFKVATRALMSVVSDRSARILDIGAGTGLLGAQVKVKLTINIHVEMYTLLPG